jgi:hypothetical protein
MEIIFFLTLICIISALFVATKWYNAGIIYGFILVLSLIGFYLSIISPMEVVQSYNYVYTYTDSVITNIEVIPVTEETNILNNGLTLLFLASVISSVVLWVTDNKQEDY